MIKLVSQFDNEKTKLSLATPTCGACCCCCCCCIISTFAAASISARSFAHYARKETPHDREEIKKARNIGFFFPLFYILSCFIGLIFFEGENPLLIMLVVAAASSIILSSMIKKGFWLAIFSLILLVGFEAFGLYCGFPLIENMDSNTYLLSAISVSIILIIFTFSKKYDNKTKVASKNINKKD